MFEPSRANTRAPALGTLSGRSCARLWSGLIRPELRRQPKARLQEQRGSLLSNSVRTALRR